MRNNKKILIAVIVLIMTWSAFSYGEGFFYVLKTHLYKNDTAQINIETEINEEFGNSNINFINNGSCDVLIRTCIFVYVMNEDRGENYIALNNSSININYGEENWTNFWYEGNDEYIYYKKPLKIGEKTEESLIKNIEIKLLEEEKELLQGKEIKVDIITEAVQDSNLAYKYEWNINDDELENYFENAKSIKENDINKLEGIRIIIQ